MNRTNVKKIRLRHPRKWTKRVCSTVILIFYFGKDWNITDGCKHFAASFAKVLVFFSIISIRLETQFRKNFLLNFDMVVSVSDIIKYLVWLFCRANNSDKEYEGIKKKKFIRIQYLKYSLLYFKKFMLESWIPTGKMCFIFVNYISIFRNESDRRSDLDSSSKFIILPCSLITKYY